jgi:hypothetical protein
MPACALRLRLPAFYSASKTLTQKPHTHVFPSHMVVIVYSEARDLCPVPHRKVRCVSDTLFSCRVPSDVSACVQSIDATSADAEEPLPLAAYPRTLQEQLCAPCASDPHFGRLE